MPVPDQAPVNASTGNGITTVFPYTFMILDEEDLLVEVAGVEVAASAYSVSGVGDEGGGSVTFTSPPADGAIVVRSRNMPYERTDTDYQEGGGFEAATVDEDIDRGVLMAQQLGLAVNRSIKGPRSVSADQSISEADWAAGAGKVFRRKADGAGIDLVSVDDVGDLYTASMTGAVARSFSAKVADIVSVRDFGAACDDSTDDTAAWRNAIAAVFAAGVALYHPGGISKVTDELDATAYYGITIMGAGNNAGPTYDNVVSGIRQYTNDKAILRVHGSGCRIENLYLDYDSQQTTAHTNSRGLELNNFSQSVIRNVKVYRANTAIGIPQSAFGATAYNVVWDTVIDNVKLYESSECFLDLRCYNGGGTNVAIINPCFNGGGSLDFVTVGQTCNYVIRGSNWVGYVFDTMSIDGMTVNQVPIDASGNCKYGIDYIRFEGVKVTPDAANWIKNAGSTSNVRIGQVEFRTCRWDPSAASSMYLFNANATQSHLYVGKVLVDSDCDFGSSGTRRVLTTAAAESGTRYRSRIEIWDIEDQGSRLSDITAWTDGLSGPLHAVRIWDGALVTWRTKAGRTGSYVDNVLDTAPPTAGTWKVGDTVWNVRPDLNGIVNWTCVAAGTPGTWKVGAPLPTFSVTQMDDFLGDVLADQWNGRVGSNGSCVTPTINANTNGGQVRLVTGADAGGTMALNGSQLEAGRNWAASGSGLSMEFRVQLSAITNVAIFVGFTDQNAALEAPIISAGAADTLTNNADDAVGVMFDTSMSTDNWWMVGVAATVGATAQNSASAPVAGVFEIWRIELSTAGVATFYRNGVLVGTAMSGAITAATLITPVVAAFSRGAASRNIDIDFIEVRGKR